MKYFTPDFYLKKLHHIQKKIHAKLKLLHQITKLLHETLKFSHQIGSILHQINDTFRLPKKCLFFH